jgi:hypothetical protein
MLPFACPELSRVLAADNIWLDGRTRAEFPNMHIQTLVQRFIMDCWDEWGRHPWRHVVVAQNLIAFGILLSMFDGPHGFSVNALVMQTVEDLMMHHHCN